MEYTLENYCARTIANQLEEIRKLKEEKQRLHDMFISSQKQIDQLSVQVDKLTLENERLRAQKPKLVNVQTSIIEKPSPKPKLANHAIQTKRNKLATSRAIHADTFEIAKAQKPKPTPKPTPKPEPKPEPKPKPKPKKSNKADAPQRPPRSQRSRARPQDVAQQAAPVQAPAPQVDQVADPIPGFTRLNQVDPFVGPQPMVVLPNVQVQTPEQPSLWIPNGVQVSAAEEINEWICASSGV